MIFNKFLMIFIVRFWNLTIKVNLNKTLFWHFHSSHWIITSAKISSMTVFENVLINNFLDASLETSWTSLMKLFFSRKNRYLLKVGNCLHKKAPSCIFDFVPVTISSKISVVRVDLSTICIICRNTGFLWHLFSLWSCPYTGKYRSEKTLILALSMLRKIYLKLHLHGNGPRKTNSPPMKLT